jgi:glutamate synthase domain-containing protein 2
VRIRIALATAVAVIATPAVLFTLFSSTPAASARVTRHEAVSQRRAVKIDMELMSYAQAEKVAKLVTYSNDVSAQQQTTYLKDVAFMTYLKNVNFTKAVALQKQQAAQQAAAQQAAAVQAAAPAPAPAPAVAPALAAAPAAAAAAGSSDATSTNTPDWACIREHESGGNYGDGNGGAYQFEFGTWQALTGLPSPAEDYPPAVQDAAALKLFAERGWEPWTTRYVCGL